MAGEMTEKPCSISQFPGRTLNLKARILTLQLQGQVAAWKWDVRRDRWQRDTRK